jgi:hypothetical protein
LYSNTAVRSLQNLVVRVLFNETICQEDYFCFGITVHEETLLDMSICQWVMIFWTPETAYILCRRCSVEVNGFSMHIVTQGRGMSDAEKGDCQVWKV